MHWSYYSLALSYQYHTVSILSSFMRLFYTCGYSLNNSLWSSDTIWWPKSGSTLAQVMACCLRAPSHYLNQCGLIINRVFTGIAWDISSWYEFENYNFEITATSSRGQWVHTFGLCEAIWLIGTLGTNLSKIWIEFENLLFSQIFESVIAK